MSPDIEWRVGEDTDQEILTQTTTRPGRGQRLAWIIVITLGLGLGIFYHMLPVPIEPPVATATPTPAPAPTLPPPIDLLTASIGREAQALAHGDRQMFMALQDPADERWQQEQSDAFESWGTPVDGSLYTIVNSGTLTDDRAWAEVIQYRNAEYFRELRFYQLAPDRLSWLRMRPVQDQDFWGPISADNNSTEHFTIVARERDTFEAWWAARQFEQLYAEACNAMACWGVQPSQRYFTLALLPEYAYPSMQTDESAQRVTVTLPSPHIMGIYEQDPRSNDLGHDQRIVSYFDQFVFPWMIYNTSGGFARWSKNRDGLILVSAISNWTEAQLGHPRGNDFVGKIG
jgi:hypothetical protein